MGGSHGSHGSHDELKERSRRGAALSMDASLGAFFARTRLLVKKTSYCINVSVPGRKIVGGVGVSQYTVLLL